MPICHSHKFVFVHVPKCGGTTITRALIDSGIKLEFHGRATETQMVKYRSEWLHHITADCLREHLTPAVWEEYQTFAVVRNPWDLLVSYYFYHQKKFTDPNWKGTLPPNIFAPTRTFREWFWVSQLIPQCSYYICDDRANKIVKYIGRFERLDEDYFKIASTLGFTKVRPLPRLNASVHGGYRTYYDRAMRKRVEDVFRDDIRLFNYKF
jgi:hypothetical protein